VSKIVIKDNQELKKQKENEFEFGLRPNYKKIGKYANDDYAYKKNMMNPLAGFNNVDLIFTGAFVNSLFVISKSERRFIFDSGNDKKDNLIERYGEAIMGLNQVWFNKRQSEIYRLVLQQQIKQIYKIA